MIPYDLSELRDILSAEVVGKEDAQIKHIAIDSRNIVQSTETVFIAFKGAKFNGHEYISDAYEKGIRTYIVEITPQEVPEDANYLIVKDTRKALQQWAKYHVQQMNVPIIGITGSKGKTVVKEWLYQLLLNNFRLVKSPKSYNSQIGVPLSVLEIEASDELALVELGISQPQEMHLIADIVQPQIGVLTNIGSAHAAFFSTREEHITEKIRLFSHSEIVIYPYDDKQVRDKLQKQYGNKKLVGFGKSESATVKLEGIRDDTIEVKFNNKKYTISIPSKDDVTIQNAITCFTVLTQLDIDIAAILPAYQKLSAVDMRLEIKEGINNCVIINDTFNADLSSVPLALKFLSRQNKEHKVLVLTDILQNRLQNEKLYTQIAAWTNSYKVDKVFLIGDEIIMFKDLFEAFEQSFSTTNEFLDSINVSHFTNSAILLKGARLFKLERISKKFEDKSHDTVLEVNLDHLINNVNYFRSKLSVDTKLMCMVKAFGYGTGGFEVAQALVGHHVDYLGVAYADEGAELRRKGITTPIMVMNPEQSSYDTIIENNLEAEIYSLRVLEKFTLKLIEKRIAQSFPIHIKLNTGMNRLGFKQDEVSELIRQLADNPYVRVVSIFSHLATSDIPSESDFVHHQVEAFKVMYDKLSFNLGYKPMAHILNSAGILNFPEYQMDMVRLGIGMYGLAEQEKDLKFLKNVVTFKTVISQITDLSIGESVSYGRNFRADQPMRIATLPVGYADGIKRCLGNEIGKVSIHGQTAHILGTVCMDMIMVDVTEIICEEGDEVILFGENPSLKEIADNAGTITYEILTSISSRVKRIYIQ